MDKEKANVCNVLGRLLLALRRFSFSGPIFRLAPSTRSAIPSGHQSLRIAWFIAAGLLTSFLPGPADPVRLGAVSEQLHARHYVLPW